MVEFFNAGGPVMWPLLFCAIIGIAFIIERVITYALTRVNITAFMSGLKETIRKKDVQAGIEYCKAQRSPVARIVEAALERYRKVGPRKDVLEEAIASAGTTELAFLDRGLPILAAVSTIAPILGFLGTVAGMIGAFNAIAIAGEVEPTLVASGISEALITTATGLAIAFPMVAAHVYFSTRSNAYTRTMETAATDLVSLLVEEKVT